MIRILDEYRIWRCGLDSSESEQDIAADVRPYKSRASGQSHVAYGNTVLG